MSSLFDKPTEVSEMKATLQKLFSPSSQEALPLEKRLQKLPEAELNMILNAAKMVHLAVKGQSRLGQPNSYLKQTRDAPKTTWQTVSYCGSARGNDQKYYRGT